MESGAVNAPTAGRYIVLDHNLSKRATEKLEIREMPSEAISYRFLAKVRKPNQRAGLAMRKGSLLTQPA
jgi:hypothetical protein